MRAVTLLATALAFAALAAPARAAEFNFVSLGDYGCAPIGGWHAQDELTVAAQFMKSTAAMKPRFILNPGDNFYYCGVHNKTDSMWESTFENVFTDPSTFVPWYSALGNHDYGYPGSATAQMEYKSPKNNRWVMPDRYYYKRLEFPGEVNISLVVLDASPCQSMYVSSDPSGWDPCGSVIPGCPGCTFHENVIKQSCTAQLAWLQKIVPTIPSADWKIAMIHAPGSDIDVADLITPLQQGKFDLVVNGHVHLLAHYTMDNVGTYITSGAGCMVKIEDRAPTLKAKLGSSSCTSYSTFHTCQIVWQQTIAGYTTHSFNSDFTKLTTKILDYSGNTLYTVDTEKGGVSPPSPPSTSSSGSSSGSAPPSQCCYYSDSSCVSGQMCCDEEGKSYTYSSCTGQFGTKHNCYWADGLSECLVE